MPEKTATNPASLETTFLQEAEETEEYPTLEKEEISVAGAFKEAVFLSPEGFFMMSSAIFADVSEVLFEVFLPGPGHIISIIIDAGALVLIGGWMLFRSAIKGREMGELPPSLGKRKKIMQKEAIKAVSKATKRAAKWGKRLKWLRPVLIVAEMIPIIGSIPGWTVAVYLELKYS